MAVCSLGSECNDRRSGLPRSHWRRLRRRYCLARRPPRCLLGGYQSVPHPSPELGGFLRPHLVIRRTGHGSFSDRLRRRACVVLGSRVILWEPSMEVRRDSLFHLDGWPTVRLNDARSDPRGSLWVGSMRNNVNADGSAGEVGGRDGVLIRLDPDGRHTCYRERMEFPTLWLGVRIGTTFTSGTRSQTSFGSTTTIHRPVQFPTNILFSKASAAGYLTARPSIRKAIFGIAGSMETALCGLLPMEKLIAWWKCP